MPKLNQKVALLLKLTISLGLIIYLVISGGLNLTIIGTALHAHPWLFGLATLLLLIPIMLTSFRWRMLLLAQDSAISFRKTLSLNLIGCFFNVFLPGGTGGDLVKGYYIASIYPNKKTSSITTILVDRFLGLTGLVLLAGLFVLLNPDISFRTTGVIKSFSLAILLLNVIIIFCLVFFLNVPMPYLEKHEEKFSHFPGGGLFLKVYHALRVYRDHQTTIYLALIISMMVHSSIVAMNFIFGQIAGATLSWRYYGVVIPFGLAANSLPLSPGGLGVGEAATEYFFHQVGSPLGGEILVLFHLVSILWGILAGLPMYLLFKKEPRAIMTNQDSLKAEITL